LFIDRVLINVKAGKGGNGCISFRREKYVPRGGPDGGDGGRGGDVIIRVEPQMRTLLDLRYRRHYKAEDGRTGRGKRMTGRSGSPVVIGVPPGTVVQDSDSGILIGDLTEAGHEIVVARGGSGGRGN
jgi:GTP-binding protein